MAATLKLTLDFLSSFLSDPPDPPFLSCCSRSRCFLDFLFFFFGLGSGGGSSSGSDSESESLELIKEAQIHLGCYSLCMCVYLKVEIKGKSIGFCLK